MVFGKGLIHSVLGLLMSSKELFLQLFIIPTIAIWIHIDLTAINLIYFIATELILAHVIYGGSVILKGQEKLSGCFQLSNTGKDVVAVWATPS